MSSTKGSSPDKETVRSRAVGHWPRVFSALVPQFGLALESIGRHVDCPLPQHGGAGDFRLYRDFPETGGGACTCGRWSDGFALLQAATGMGFHETICEVASVLGGDIVASHAAPAMPSKPKVSERSADQVRLGQSRLWSVSLELSHPDAEPARLYFANRGIPLPEHVPLLRYNPSLIYMDGPKVQGKFPGLLAKVVSPKREVVTLHRTYLTSTGYKADVPNPRKLMELPSDRSMAGAAVPLFPVVGAVLALAEGLETAYAVSQLFDIPCWSCISAVFMETFVPPPGVDRLLIFADLDVSGTGERSARILAERCQGLGIQVQCYLPQIAIESGKKGADFLDVLNARQRRCLQAA
jgi:phage/plasmid primase-like uncharacterized protein